VQRQIRIRSDQADRRGPQYSTGNLDHDRSGGLDGFHPRADLGACQRGPDLHLLGTGQRPVYGHLAADSRPHGGRSGLAELEQRVIESHSHLERELGVQTEPEVRAPFRAGSAVDPAHEAVFLEACAALRHSHRPAAIGPVASDEQQLPVQSTICRMQIAVQLQLSGERQLA
jgi:hypothetical protein